MMEHWKWAEERRKRLDRCVGWRRWSPTWREEGVANKLKGARANGIHAVHALPKLADEASKAVCYVGRSGCTCRSGLRVDLTLRLARCREVLNELAETLSDTFGAPPAVAVVIGRPVGGNPSRLSLFTVADRLGQTQRGGRD